MDKAQKLDRVRELTNLVSALATELNTAKARVKELQVEIRKTEAMREELITSTETQTTFARASPRTAFKATEAPAARPC